MVPITATIITLNEEDRVAEAIASLACCDEILVVDAGSSDRTRQIAALRGARVLTRDWDGYSSQKNFAASQAAHDWILSIDADERLSIELADEIARWKQVAAESTSMAALSMPRHAFYLGKWIGHSGWYPDRKVRLYDRRRARWEGDFVHETMKVDGALGEFRHDLLHFPFRSIQDHLARMDRYTRLAAHAARTQGGRANVLKLIFGPPLSFVKAYIVQAGFLDGWRGLAISYLAARYVFLRQLRILSSWNSP